MTAPHPRIRAPKDRHKRPAPRPEDTLFGLDSRVSGTHATSDLIIVDLFAGAGGASTGYEQALGVDISVAVNHSPDAIEAHTLNHPGTRHYLTDVFEVDPLEATQGRPVDLLHASPDCFPAGTLVLTRQGYRPIEELLEGDEVYTHQNRWRPVTRTYVTERSLVEVRGYGHPGLAVSPEHPFYVRQRTRAWDNDRRGYNHTLNDPTWTKVADFPKDDTGRFDKLYWATPTAFPAEAIPELPSRPLPVDERLLWLAGHYVGDGWTRLGNGRAELVITCAKSQGDAILAQLDRWPRAGKRGTDGELAWHRRDTETATQHSTNHQGLVTWLREQFGHRSEGKGVPSWLYGAPEHLRRAFLDGYMAADGHFTGQYHTAQTSSRYLAFGLRTLLGTLGYSAAVRRFQNREHIQGRPVNACEAYQIRWWPVLKRKQVTFEDGHAWAPIREVKDLGRNSLVYNIEVKDDQSYVVEGIVVHNCTSYSSAKGAAPVRRKLRSLPWVALRWLGTVRPRFMVMENVSEIMTDWGPLVARRDAAGKAVMIPRVDDRGQPVTGPDGAPLLEQQLTNTRHPKKRNRHWKTFLAEIRRLGYHVEHRVLCAADYGAATTRERLFIIASRDHDVIPWPEQTHAAPNDPRVKSGELLPWVGVESAIDFSVPTRSVFGRARPLADTTLRRVAQGLARHHLRGEAYLITANHGSATFRGQSVTAPMATITAAHDAHGLISALSAQGERVRAWPSAIVCGQTDPKAAGLTARDAAALILGVGGRAAQSVPRNVNQPLYTTTTKADVALLQAPVNQGNHAAAVYDLLCTHLDAATLDALRASGHLRDHDREVRVQHAGQWETIRDLGLRMLNAEELKVAQSFPASYALRHADRRDMSEKAKVRLIGNSVPPKYTRAIGLALKDQITQRTTDTLPAWLAARRAPLPQAAD